MDWRQLDFPTRAAFVATVMALLGVLVPPISVASALIAIAFSGSAVHRARRRRERNRVALICLAVSGGLVVLVIVGSAIYSAGT
ncbi:MAG: hypothetical protein ABI894_04955 [Ilumatobacteraceae bacterium]